MGASSSLKTLYLILTLLVLLQSACSHLPGIRPDAVAELKLAAESGDARAQLLLAHLLDEGAGVPRDLDAAATWYRKSAGQNDPDAGFELARLQLFGKSPVKDDNGSIRLLFKAGETGNSRAQALLGALFIAGRGRDEFAARVKLVKSGAGKGEARSQYMLGWILREGAGVPRASAEAQLWLTKAAKQGNGPAALLLGDMAFNGEAAQKDTSAAIRWYEKAAAAGDSVAVARLYQLHGNGINGTVPLPELAPRQSSAIKDGYRRLQLAFAEEKSAKDQEIALVAVRRLLELDPLDREARDLADRLWRKSGGQITALIMKAEQQVATGEIKPFVQNLTEIIALYPDESRLRELGARYWQRMDDLFRKAEKDASDILRSLESFDSAESIRKNHSRIQRLMTDFNDLLEKMSRDRPGDPRLTPLTHKFERMTAAIAKKRDDHRDERKEEQTGSGDVAFRKGLSLLEGGQFDAAAKLFEKLARTPGYTNVAAAYIHLGIASLARINMAKVQEAKKLRLKGIASFQNALRFDKKAALPDGYVKYQDIFEEARSFLK